MDDWKDSIRSTIKDQVDANAARENKRQEEMTAEDRRTADQARFLKEVVRPALEEIKAELVANGLGGSISEASQEITLSVVENGVGRFSYGVTGACQACVRASGASASIGAIPLAGPTPTGEDIKRHFGGEFRSIFSRRRQ